MDIIPDMNAEHINQIGIDNGIRKNIAQHLLETFSIENATSFAAINRLEE